MFFDDDSDNEQYIDPEFFHAVRREFLGFSPGLEVTQYSMRSVPTHTEDGIPIRKIYVSNLPTKTTRNELFGVFAQYGFIKSCWLRMGEKGHHKSQVPTYAFVTYSNPADAHKALIAPIYEKQLRGRNLYVSPADSWHQPAEDADGNVPWKPRSGPSDVSTGDVPGDNDAVEEPGSPEIPPESKEPEPSAETSEQPQQNDNEAESSQAESSYTMLDVLNQDCLMHILSYVPIRDLIRSERVSKSWQNMIQEYLESMRVFKTSWWQHVTVTLTTAVLRRLLQRLGESLLRLHIDHHWSALNDRTAHTVGKFCPNLEELVVVGMHTKNWNPLVYGCKQLKSICFVSCNKLTDFSLMHMLKKDCNIESVTVANNTHVTGVFLTGPPPPKLTSLALHNCYSLQGTVICASMKNLHNIKKLKLDLCPLTTWKHIPLILKKLPKLEELSLSEYTSVDLSIAKEGNDALCEALSMLTELKNLDLSRNIYISNAVLKQVSQSCQKLEVLNVACCNAKKTFPFSGVGDEGLAAVFKSCGSLRRVDMSYLAGLTDAGAATAAKCATLHTLTVRGSLTLTNASLATCLAACHQLQLLDVCGCDNVSEALVEAAARAVAARAHPVPIRLHVGGTTITTDQDLPKHKLLTVDLSGDRCSPHLRADFMDGMLDCSDDDSMDQIAMDALYDHDDIEDIFGLDDDYYDEDDDDSDEYEGMYMHHADIYFMN